MGGAGSHRIPSFRLGRCAATGRQPRNSFILTGPRSGDRCWPPMMLPFCASTALAHHGWPAASVASEAAFRRSAVAQFLLLALLVQRGPQRRSARCGLFDWARSQNEDWGGDVRTGLRGHPRRAARREEKSRAVDGVGNSRFTELSVGWTQIIPPLARMVWPVIQWASSLTSMATTSAMSSGWPSRPRAAPCA